MDWVNIIGATLVGFVISTAAIGVAALLVGAAAIPTLSVYGFLFGAYFCGVVVGEILY